MSSVLKDYLKNPLVDDVASLAIVVGGLFLEADTIPDKLSDMREITVRAEDPVWLQGA